MSFDEEYKHLAELNTQIKEAEDALKLLKQAKKSQKEVMEKALGEEIRDMKAKDAKKLCSDLYWNDSNITLQIFRAYKYFRRSPFHPLSTDVSVSCIKCGIEIIQKCNTLAARKNFLLGIEKLCDSCTFEKYSKPCEDVEQQNPTGKFSIRFPTPKKKKRVTLEDTFSGSTYYKKAEVKKTIVENTVDLKTMPYKEYLLTDHWRKIRKSALIRADYACQLCKNTDQLHVHHNTYERRGCESSSDVIVLCWWCHGKFHDKLSENADIEV